MPKLLNSVKIASFLKFFCGQIAFVPPSFSKTADEGFLEELIKGYLEFFAKDASWLADVPMMHIDSSDTSDAGETDRVEGTGDGFLPVELATTVGRINGTEGTCPFMLDEDTVFAIDDLGNKFTVFIRIYNSFAIDELLGIGGKVIPNGRGLYGLFKQFHFFDGDGGTSISFDAASSMTLGEVAAEEGFEEVERNEGVENFKHDKWMGIGFIRINRNEGEGRNEGDNL